MAEELFQKLIPEAIDANRYWRVNNPDFDFMYKGLKIDIKYSSLHMKGIKKDIKTWRIRTSGEYDLIVAFLEKEADSVLQNYEILLIPNGVIAASVLLELREHSEIYQNFKIDVSELKSLLDMYSEVIEE